MNKNIDTPFSSLMVVIFSGAFLAILNSSSVNIMLPDLMKELHTSMDAVRWTITGFMLAMGTMAPLTGYLGEKLSYKRLYILSLVGFTFSSLLCALSWNIYSLITFRVLQGCFSGFLTPAAMTIIFQVVPKNKQASALSIWNLAAMLAPAFGPTLAGWLIQNFSWKSVFLINLPLGIITAVLAVKILPFYKFQSELDFDFPGLSTCIAASIFLLVAFSQGVSWGWSSLQIISLLSAGILFLGLFIYRELTAESPMLNLSVFKRKTFTLSVIVGCLVNIALYSATLLTPLFLQNCLALSSMDTGLVMFPSSLMLAFTTFFVGKIFEKVKPHFFVIAGMSVLALATWRMGYLTLNTSKAFVILWMSVRNIGIGLVFMPVTSIGMSVIEKKLSGHASGVNNWIRTACASLAIGIFSSLLVSRTAYHVEQLRSSGIESGIAKAQAYVSAMDDIFILAAIVLVLGFPLGFMMRKKHDKKSYELAEKTA
ncbi:MAG: MDR family MFS transporter [Clostridiaceae bacterium]